MALLLPCCLARWCRPAGRAVGAGDFLRPTRV